MISTKEVKPIEGISITGVEEENMNASLNKVFDENGVKIYEFQIEADEVFNTKPITLQWKIPAYNIKGVWKPTSDFSKRIQADWELEHMESRISIDAPVISLFGHNDTNILTFACSDAINKLEMNARLREEDNNFYCHITFFTEHHYALKNYKIQLRLDYNDVHFSSALKRVSKWWESFEILKPTYVPEIAKTPLYSTWYQFHQNLDVDILLEEFKIAYKLGYKAIIIDDGWQTNDSNRGYDYTGDWQPERIPNMAYLVEQTHQLGMKVGLWYSVPFCGKRSKAYKKFKGKFLTENHRWAPVLDPRFPEVREYLINIYKNALLDWNLDGFKLDFIDDFKLYPETITSGKDGRDYVSINESVDRLMTDIHKTLTEIKPDLFIEFRQKYTGPAMRKYGNMFRAFDCPNDATMNRVRIADIKMLCGNSAVHSDMVTWHKDEPIEINALQMINTLFGVPQLSIKLSEASSEELKMIRFYTQYWNENAEVLLEGDFIPSRPLANYSTQRVSKNNHTIIGLYDDHVITIKKADRSIHILNAQIQHEVVLRCTKDLGEYKSLVYNCQGNLVANENIFLNKGISSIKIPPCGVIQLNKI